MSIFLVLKFNITLEFVEPDDQVKQFLFEYRDETLQPAF